MNVKLYSCRLSILTAIFAGVFAASCNVDDSYDLSKINNEVGLGTDESEFYMPLISVVVDPAEAFSGAISNVSLTSYVSKSEAVTYDVPNVGAGLNDDNGRGGVITNDIFDNLDDFSALLPSNNGEFGLDLYNLSKDPEYRDRTVDSFVEELKGSEEKCEAFCNVVYENNNSMALKEFVMGDKLGREPALYEGDSFLNVDLSDVEGRAKALQAALNREDTKIAISEFKDQVANATIDILEDNFTQQISAGSIELGRRALDLINSNLDGGKNRIYLLATFDTDLDLDIVLDLKITNRGEQIDVPAINSFVENPFDGLEGAEINGGSALADILSNLDIDVKFYIKNFKPGEKIVTKGKYIKFMFVIRKTGSLMI